MARSIAKRLLRFLKKEQLSRVFWTIPMRWRRRIVSIWPVSETLRQQSRAFRCPFANDRPPCRDAFLHWGKRRQGGASQGLGARWSVRQTGPFAVRHHIQVIFCDICSALVLELAPRGLMLMRLQGCRQAAE